MSIAWEEQPPQYSDIRSESPIRYVVRYLSPADLAAASRQHYPASSGDAVEQAEAYNNPPETWLVNVLEQLEGLSNFVVRGLPFFDHAALSSLLSKITSPSTLKPGPQVSLRLLDASRCENATATGLVAALGCMRELLYLDLSSTKAARDHTVLAQVKHLTALKILRLRAVSLKDGDLRVLAAAVGARLRSLDVSRNLLTDDSVAVLLAQCVLPDLSDDARSARRIEERDRFEIIDRLDVETIRTYEGDGFERYVRHESTARFVPQFAFEAMPDDGLTHLYISHNHLTIVGIEKLLRPGKLNVLAANGNYQLNTAKLPGPGWDKGGVSPATAHVVDQTVMVEGGMSLRSLRIDYDVLMQRKAHPLQGISERNALTQPPSYDSILSEQGEPASFGSSDRRAQPLSHDSILASPHYRLQTLDHSTYHSLTTPNLRKLLLRNVPSHSLDSTVAERLQSFISECATEARLARSHAQVVVNSSLPANNRPPTVRQRRERLEQAERERFALESIVLEVVDTKRRGLQGRSSGREKSAWNPEVRDYSSGGGGAVTGDVDSGNMWRAGEGDFSFFGGGGDDGDGDSEGGRGGWAEPEEQGFVPAARTQLVDNIGLLSAFRKNKRAEYERRSKRAGGADEPVVEGYWPGVVTVIRRGEFPEPDAEDVKMGLEYYRLMYE